MKVMEIVKKIFSSNGKIPLDKYKTPIGEKEKHTVFLHSGISIYVTLDSKNKSRYFIPTIIEKDINGAYYFTGFMVDDEYADMINTIASRVANKYVTVLLSLRMIFTHARVCSSFMVDDHDIAAILNASSKYDDTVKRWQKALVKLEVRAGGIERKTNWVYLLKDNDIFEFGKIFGIKDSVFFTDVELMNKGNELALSMERVNL